ncbi:unnamed protein product, partial [Effrenium voratum]
VLRQFLLIRAGSIGDISELKAWVSKEEADRVHKTLEEFRDEVNEEKVMRRLNMKRAASEGSWSCISKGSSKEEKKKKKNKERGARGPNGCLPGWAKHQHS